VKKKSAWDYCIIPSLQPRKPIRILNKVFKNNTTVLLLYGGLWLRDRRRTLDVVGQVSEPKNWKRKGGGSESIMHITSYIYAGGVKYSLL
jgi:hypothetical protein